MLPAQRRRTIVNEVNTKGSVSIIELSAKHDVSEMTIRRDLKMLEKEGLVKCTHGGAVDTRYTAEEVLNPAKRDLNVHKKQKIALYAAEHFVADNDVIIMESGTTVTAMAQHLTGKRNLTIATNGLYTVTELKSLLKNDTILCTGGILRDVSFTFIGPIAEQFFQDFYAEKLFLSGVGFTLETGLTDPKMIDTQVKKAMIKSASKTIVMIDSSKFAIQSVIPVIRAYEIDVLITDEDAPDFMLDELRRHGVDVHVVS